MELKGKSALVCGASQGIGAATARILTQKGVQVTLVSRSADKLKALSEELDAGYWALDLADHKSLKAKITSQAFDILVCNAGGPPAGPLLEAKPEAFRQAFEAHVVANQILVQSLVPAMKQKGYGRIINIISTSVKVPIPNLGVSNTIRGAVANWSKTLATELAPFGITVNNVLPGYTKTPRLENLLKNFAEKQSISYEEAVEQWKERVPAKRFAKPEETAEAIAFLASPQAGYINGVNLPVDGGRTGCL